MVNVHSPTYREAINHTDDSAKPPVTGSPDAKRHAGLDFTNISLNRVDLVIVTSETVSKKSLTEYTHDVGHNGLKEFLSIDLPQARIIPCELNLQDNLDGDLSYPATKLLKIVLEARRTDPYRPIIFIAHSLSGVVAKLALLLASKNPEFHPIADSTRGIAFFGTPQREAIYDEELRELLAGETFRAPLKLGSKDVCTDSGSVFSMQSRGRLALSLDSLHVAWVNIYAKQLRVASFYETIAPVVPFKIAVLGLAGESIVALNTSHNKLLHVDSRNDKSYRRIRDRLAWMLNEALESDASRRYIGFDGVKLLERLWPGELVSCEYKKPLPAIGTSSWFLSHSSYRAWLDTKDSGLFWLKGKPGAGKSTLMRFLTRDLRGHHQDVADTSSQYYKRQSPSAIVCSYFVDYTAPPRSSELILRSLVHQVLARQPSLMQFVPASLKQHQYWKDDSDFSLSATLHHLSSHNRIIILIDGLDEANEIIQHNLISALCQLKQPQRLDRTKAPTVNNSPNPTTQTQLKIGISSRRYLSDIGLDEDLQCYYVDLSLGDAAKGLKEDAWVILESRLHLGQTETPEVLTPILEQLASKQDTAGILLWAQVIVKAITSSFGGATGGYFPNSKHMEQRNQHDFAALLLSGPRSQALVENIAGLPKQLSSLYQSCLDRHDDQVKSVAHQALKWILVAQKPLTLVELSDVLTPRSPRHLKASTDYSSQEMLHKALGGLIEVINSEVYFVHQSVKDFLLYDFIDKRQDGSREHASPQLLNFHRDSLISCIDYLGAVESNEYTALPTVEVKALSLRWPFLSYAATYWHSHLELSNLQAIAQRSLNRLSSPESLIFKLWFEIWKYHQSRGGSGQRGLPERPTKVIVWCLLGNKAQVSHSLNERSMMANGRSRSDNQWTPLMAAAWSGHNEIVTLLLSRPEVRDSRPQQKAEALIYAIERGHTAVAQSLTAFFANPAAGPRVLNTVVNHETALSAAIVSYDLCLAQLLLDLGADPMLHLDRRVHRQRRCGVRNSLHYAIYSGVVEPLSLLLDSLPESERQHQYRELLPIASCRGATSSIQYLVRNADIPQLHEGTTALQLAARFGHADVVDILLNHGAPMHHEDKTVVYTIFQFACHFDKTQAARLMQHSSAQWVEGAFFHACQSVSAPTVKHLLSSGVSARVAKEGIPALQWVLIDGESFPGIGFGKPAHEESRIEVLKLLLDAGSDVNKTDGSGQTSLHLAANRGEKQITAFLISRGVDVNLRDRHGNTALDIAASSGDTHWIHSFILAGSEISSRTWKSVLASADVEAACYILDSVTKTASALWPSHSGHGTSFTGLDPHPSEVYFQFLNYHPPQRFTKAANYLRYMHITDYANVRIETCAPLSLWSSFTRWWEEFTGTRWLWWPLPAPLPRLRRGETYIHWKCHGCHGNVHSDVIPQQLGQEVEMLIDFQRRLLQIWPGEAPQFQQVAIPSTASNALQHNPLPHGQAALPVENLPLDPRSQSSTAPSAGDTEAFELQAFREQTHHNSNAAFEVKSDTDESEEESESEDDPDDDHPMRKGRYVHVKPRGFPLAHIDTEATPSECEFLEALHETYRARQSCFRRYLSIYRFSHWGFDRFTFWQGRFLSHSEGSEKDCYLPDAQESLDYDFTRAVDDGRPPISHEFFHQSYHNCPYICRRRGFMHQVWCNSKGDDVEARGTGAENHLPKIPKRYEKWDPERDPDCAQACWGLSAFELPNIIGCILYTFVLPVTLAVVFWILWLSDMGHEGDLQNATVPLFIFLALWAVLWTTIGKRGWNKSTAG
ncbi:hypothetical protein PFICI_08159 [Pestalotiopsis fici W106-1]|uniref:Nephrocystin 3-like N-terminal domain-containing protein n=1 Tax=Pestalotiopsis fici (strain W106-1 / CGMCC3.15140) TaxID=1229662 RepID=W3X3H6_PESFW|nr:uncharacterized protein PFICI_08159 [Pestalotiopsis fici W106-1]ETS80630.1 hypothetical protein PFICI_08159 [Pestalotiopsis fici W106-1]